MLNGLISMNYENKDWSLRVSPFFTYDGKKNLIAVFLDGGYFIIMGALSHMYCLKNASKI